MTVTQPWRRALRACDVCDVERDVNTAFTSSGQCRIVACHRVPGFAAHRHQFEARAVPELDVAVQQVVRMETARLQAKAVRQKRFGRPIEIADGEHHMVEGRR